MNVWLRALNWAILERKESRILSAHDSLLAQLRNQNNPAPDWERYPAARDFFTQTLTDEEVALRARLECARAVYL